MKVRQSKIDLEERLKEQLDFLIRSASYYDSGTLNEAKRMAVSVRVLLHDTKSSHSLMKQLNIKNIGFLDTTIPYNKLNQEYYFGLVRTTITVTDKKELIGENKPFLDNLPAGVRRRKRFFPEWWNQTVLVDSKKNKFNRRTIVLSLANTDGGAHVDPMLNAEYKALSRDNSMGMGVPRDSTFSPISGFELATMRQIAYEVIHSIQDRYPKYINDDI